MNLINSYCIWSHRFNLLSSDIQNLYLFQRISSFDVAIELDKISLPHKLEGGLLCELQLRGRINFHASSDGHDRRQRRAEPNS